MIRSFTSNPLAGFSMSGVFALLLLLSSSLLTAASPPAAAAGAIARIENLTKLPGSNRGFPAEDYFTFHRALPERNSLGQPMRYTDRSKMRIHNDGTSTLVITKLTTTNTNNFRINGVTIPSGGLQIAPKSFRDVEVVFVTNSGDTRRLVTETLVMQSNADNAGSVRATFRGAFMKLIEGGSEINVQKVMDAFGFNTSMGVDANGNPQVRPSSQYPDPKRVNAGLEGDLILAGLFEQASTSQPVRMIQLGAFHGPGGAPTELRNEASTRIVGSMKYNHGDRYHQTLLPRITNDSREPAGDYTSTTGEPFQILVAGFRSTGGTYENTRKDELLGVRIYKVIDRSGRVVPNEYIVIQDYIGSGCGAGSSNCDWNDNVSYITNVRPLKRPSARAIASVTAEVGTTKSVNVSGAFDRGYAGNVLTYSATLADGSRLPSWIGINSATGAVVINAPSSAGGQSYSIRVTATDLNRLRVSSTLSLSVTGSSTPPPTDPDPEPDEEAFYWLEAECATVGSSFKLNAGSVVSTKRSMSAPPSDVSANRIRFTLEVADAGQYNLFARIKAPDGNSDSYYVRANGGSWYKWSSGIQQGSSFDWNRLPPGLSLRAGNNTIDFAYREPLTELDKIYVTTANSAPFGAGSPGTNCDAEPSSEVFWLEAECADVGSRWRTSSTSSASNGNYVVATANSTATPPADEAANRVRFTLIGAAGGSYRLHARINAPSGLDDSYWVRVNGGSWYKWFSGIRQRAGFQWNELPQRLSLREGSNTVDFAFREDGAQLDKIYLTTGTTQPAGLGEPATNCSVARSQVNTLAGAQQHTAVPVAGAAGVLNLFPNPATYRLTLALRSSYTGEVSVIVTDVRGRRLSVQRYVKEQEQWQTDLDVADLPAGLYHLQLLAGSEQLLQSFIRQ